jgi:hypothetical protein
MAWPKQSGINSSLALTIVLLHLLFYMVPIPKILVVENVFDGYSSFQDLFENLHGFVKTLLPFERFR